MIRHRIPRGTPTKILEVRPWVEADLAALRSKRAVDRIQNLRDSHHGIARCIAAGLNNLEIAEVTGYSTHMIARHRQDPSVMELVARMREKITDRVIETIVADQIPVKARAAQLKLLNNIIETADIAEESGEPIPLKTAASAFAVLADRFGYGAKTTSVNVSVGFAASLEAAIARTRRLPPPEAAE